MSWQGWLCLSADAQVLGRQGILQAADLHACVELVAGRGGHVAEVNSARTHTALERAWPPQRETQRASRWCESTPLHLAGADINAETVKPNTRLHLAAATGVAKVAEMVRIQALDRQHMRRSQTNYGLTKKKRND